MGYLAAMTPLVTEQSGKAPGRRPAVHRWGAILWPSFLWAAVATMVFFALVDPVELHEISFPSWNLSRIAGYSIGFFMFWAVTAASSFLTWVLLRPAHSINAKHLGRKTKSGS